LRVNRGFTTVSTRIEHVVVSALLVIWLFMLAWAMPALGQAEQAQTLEERQPLELVFADSIVPQDRHETMLTTGARYFRRKPVQDGQLTQKVEWGVSDKLQISAFANPLHISHSLGITATGTGDFDVGARYTWVNAGSPFTHIALAFEGEFPSGNPVKGMGEGMYGMSPSILLSHEFGSGRYQAFSTAGFDFVLAHRHLNPADELPHHALFLNSGISRRAGRGWIVGELSISNNRWSGGDDSQFQVTPSYVWRLARRTELLVGIPLGATSSTDHIGGVVKFTFELGGDADP
jgi:hypothetical protein